MKKVIDRGKRSKMLSKVMQVENISKNLQSFPEISPMQKEDVTAYLSEYTGRICLRLNLYFQHIKKCYYKTTKLQKMLL